MNWTDYQRVKEELDMIEASVCRMKKLLRYGSREAVEMEASFMRFNYEILLEIRKRFFNTFFDVRIPKLEEEAKELLEQYYST